MGERRTSLDNIKLAVAPLSKRLMLYRHGKDPTLALEKRDAESDVMQAIVEWMLVDAPQGSTVIIEGDGRTFELKLTPITFCGVSKREHQP